MNDNLVGGCDISHQNILVNEEHYVVLPLIGRNTNLQFKLNISKQQIETFCKDIYQNISFSITKTVNDKAIDINELRLFIGDLARLYPTYKIIYNYPLVLNQILILLQKETLSSQEKKFISDMEDVGILYKKSTSNRKILDNIIVSVKKQDSLLKSRQRTTFLVIMSLAGYLSMK